MNREDLRKYKYNEQWIKDRTEYIKSYESTINKLTATITDMPSGSKSIQDSMAEKIAKLMDFANEILRCITEQQKKQQNILKQLDIVEQPYQNILFKVYIQGKNLVRVADEMNYSYERMKHMNGIALNKFDEVDTK